MTRKKGFSIIELLVVISIIAVIAGVLLPALRRARLMAWRTACASNLHQVAIGLISYLDDNNQIMPPASEKPSLKLDDKKSIAEILNPILRDPEVFLCPGDSGRILWQAEGSSYAYNSLMGGQTVSRSFFSTKLNVPEQNIHVMYDYECFHGKAKQKGAKNYLYADGHVGDIKEQK